MMNNRVESSASISPRERLSAHFATLRQYATRVICHDEVLEPWEDADRADQLEDYFALGLSLNYTHHVLVRVLLHDLLTNGS